MTQAAIALPPGRPETGERKSWWIVGAPQDVVLVIATPLLIAPLFWMIGDGMWNTVMLGALAMGHHLPGMMRAYGDFDLFKRYRARFVAAPILLGAACLWLALNDLQVLALIVLLWGVWHGLAQAFGFARVYAAKQGDSSATSRRLDLALCVAWFVAGILFSEERLGDVLGGLYLTGVPVVSHAHVELFQIGWLAATALATIAFVLGLALQWRRGIAPSLARVAILGSSCGFWWFCMIGLRDAIIGVAWFELFHDVQYLAIVWAFNLRVVDRGSPAAVFTRYLFRSRVPMLGLYLALIVAYGLFNPISHGLDGGTLKQVLVGLIATSTLLHFYYDGFIWKLRDGSIRAGLGLAGGRQGGLGLVPGTFQHLFGWGALAVVSGLLIARQIAAPPDSPLDGFESLVQITPHNPAAALGLGQELYRRGRLDEAAAQFERYIEMRRESAAGYANLGRVRLQQKKTEAAAVAYREAHRLDPRDDNALLGLGVALYELGQFDAAREAFESLITLSPRSYAATANLGALCERQGDLRCAIERYEQAVQIEPGDPVARDGLRRLRQQTRTSPTG